MPYDPRAAWDCWDWCAVAIIAWVVVFLLAGAFQIGSWVGAFCAWAR